MANPFFRFKQFTVHHNRCAMKVGTDGVLLGAWAGTKLPVRTILDVGTGSALIALMLGQRFPDARIHAVELDAEACTQAQENVSSSPFANRIEVYNDDFQHFISNEKYDLIVSNPPFFEHSLKNASVAKSTARHTDTLSPEVLIQNAIRYLSTHGRIAAIYPATMLFRLKALAYSFGLNVVRICNVYPRADVSVKRVLVELAWEKCVCTETSLVIEECRHVYTSDFKHLTQDFYLDR